MSLVERIKAEALKLGFDLVGVTVPEPPPHLSTYQDWIGKGRQAEMGYLAAERALQRRADPRLILPECRSILVLGMRYRDPRERQNISSEDFQGDEPRGRVAAYAWGDDYHDIFPEKLKALVSFIETEVGEPVPNRWYTDTGPILERDLAQLAGLGWAGKNTCLIDPESGSYYLLAEILLGVELPPDPPIVTDHCGTCTRCLEACPTSCILPDRTLDAGRCISYLTIELKGPIPEDLRTQMGNWVFGCDICQEVCPWNERFSGPLQTDRLSARTEVPSPNLREELSITPEEFNRKFKGSPVKRAKRRGYLRNVAVALGNTGRPEVIPALEKVLLEESEPLVRRHAAWALGRIGGRSALEALNKAGIVEGDPSVIEEIRSAREYLGSDGD
jgi:epoxyqueuosine reductase